MTGAIITGRDERPAATAWPVVDTPLLVAAGLLLVLGLLMVASASMPIAERQAGEPFHYLLRQGSYVLVALVLGAMTLRVPMAWWRRHGPLLLLAAVALLLAVLVPGIGKQVNGSMRWIPVGPVNVQVSEMAKLLTLIYLAGYLERHRASLSTATMSMIRPMVVMALVAGLLLLEPDFGAAAVLVATALGMVFLAGARFWHFAALQLGAIGLMSVLLYSSPYRLARLSSFVNPWADPYNSGFQLTQSLIAIGRGEMLGVGLGASLQKLFYLPEAYTDFIFAILAEELGLAGVLVVIALYVVVVWRAFRIGALAEWLRMHFAAYLAYGIGLWFAIQALVNMGVNMGVLPTKGLTLPLVSYGGSSLVSMVLALALLLRIDRETRLADPRREGGSGASGPRGEAP